MTLEQQRYLVLTEDPTGRRSKGYFYETEDDARWAVGALLRYLTEMKFFGYQVLMILDGALVVEEEIRPFSIYN